MHDRHSTSSILLGKQFQTHVDYPRPRGKESREMRRYCRGCGSPVSRHCASPEKLVLLPASLALCSALLPPQWPGGPPAHYSPPAENHTLATSAAARHSPADRPEHHTAWQYRSAVVPRQRRSAALLPTRPRERQPDQHEHSSQGSRHTAPRRRPAAAHMPAVAGAALLDQAWDGDDHW